MTANRCPHRNVQSFTECCLDCGRNVYESDADYLNYLKGEKYRRDRLSAEDEINEQILAFEKELGIKHPGNSHDSK